MAEGYESGQSPLTYKPDDTQSFEIGAKNGTNAFHVSTSLYYIRWNNIQQNVYIGAAALCSSRTT